MAAVTWAPAHADALAWQERGDPLRARRHARAALRGARTPAEAAETTLVLAWIAQQLGEVDTCADLLDRAAPALPAPARARADCLRGLALSMAADHGPALALLTRAARRLADDPRWRANALVGAGVSAARLRRFGRARAAMAEARLLYLGLGEVERAATCLHNQGFIAAQAGDIPGALACYEAAGLDERRRPEALVDRAEALLAAGLVREAGATLTRAGALLGAAGRGPAFAEATLTHARCALRLGDPRSALASARTAADLFDAQGRPSWTAVARAVELRARLAMGEPVDATRVIEECERAGELVEAAELRLATGDLAPVARHRSSPHPALRVLGWTARARLATTRRATLAACRAGIAAAPAPAHPALAAGAPGAGLADDEVTGAAGGGLTGAGSAGDLACAGLTGSGSTGVGTGAAAAGGGRAGAGLAGGGPTGGGAVSGERAGGGSAGATSGGGSARTGRGSAASGGEPSGTGQAGTGWITAGGGELAGIGLAAAVEAGRPRQVLAWSERHRGVAPTALDAVLGALGDGALITYFVHKGHLGAVSVVRRRFRLHRLGPDRAPELVPAFRRACAMAVRAPLALGLGRAARELDKVFLRPFRRVIGDRPLVVVPTAALRDVPWAALPTCAGRPVTVAESVAAWMPVPLRADGPAAWIAGPGLAHADREAATLHARHGGVLVPSGRSTREAALAALGGAASAHFAAHATNREDVPGFAALAMADGPLRGHDLDRLTAPPRHVVLSACEAARSGLAAAFLRRGAVAVVACVLPVPDDGAVELMAGVHDHLRRGAHPAEALALAQAAHGHLGFVAMGRSAQRA